MSNHAMESAQKSSDFPPKLEAVEVDLINLQEILRKGKCAKFDVRPYYDGDLLDLTLEDWRQKWGDSILFTHGLHQERLQEIEDHFASLKQGDPIVAPKPIKKKAASRGKAAAITLAELLEKIKSYEGHRRSPIWDREFESTEEGMQFYRLYDSYAVTNVRTMPAFSFNLDKICSQWKSVFNFLWVGPSSGGMHFDEFDNFLVQIHGTKSVLIYAPELTPLVDGDHYVKKFSGTKPLAPSTLAEHEYMKYLPFTIVDLRPGEGVVIPAGAYHSAYATSFDSISINSLLVPRLFRGPMPYLRHLKPSIFVCWSIWLSRKLYSLFGYRLIKLGPYEFV